MLAKTMSCALLGMNGYLVQVEVDVSTGMPSFEIVGLGGGAVKESRERVRAALKNLGYAYPRTRITCNLAPADIKKDGSSFDMAIAIGILAASDQIKAARLSKILLVGELGLDGSVRSVKGILAMVLTAKSEGIERVYVPFTNKDEASIVSDIEVIPVASLSDVVLDLNGENTIKAHHSIIAWNKILERKVTENDFCHIKGQETVKRALEIAASGGHNILMMGSPGSGKTMMARSLETILPSLSFEEAIEVTNIYSIAGLLPEETPIVQERPFRSPHHTTSLIAMVGGGRIPKPGEVSLAHHGVLFLDELLEFHKNVLEGLRQPLEDRSVNISRVKGSLRYLASMMLVCAANPCKCGNLLELEKECICTPLEVRKYMSRISGPFLDRIDIQIEVCSLKYEELEKLETAERSAVIHERVEKTRKIQLERYKNDDIYVNAQCSQQQLMAYCRVDEGSQKLLKHAYNRLGLSARAHSRILKVARTIADMDASENIQMKHIAEAIQYRGLDKTILKNL